MIYKKGNNPSQQSVIDKNKEVGNEQYLIVGKSGSGKSIATSSTLFEHYKAGYTIIYITNKQGGEFEPAFCMLPPKEKYHLAHLKSRGINVQSVPVKMYHPFTFNMPKVQSKKTPDKKVLQKLPDINWFTFSVKNLNDKSLSIILTGDIDTEKVRTCQSVIQSLDSKSNVLDLVQKLKHNIENEEVKPSRENLFMGSKTTGDKSTISRITDSFKPFCNEDYMIQPDNFEMNLNIENILKDNNTYHILLTKFIKSKQIKYFVYIQFISEIIDSIDQHKTPNPIILVFEEVKIILPKRDPDKYESIFAKQVKELLSRCRSLNISTISTAQSINDVSSDLVNSTTQQFMFNLSLNDIKSLKKDFDYTVSELDKFKSLQNGEMIIRTDIENKS